MMILPLLNEAGDEVGKIRRWIARDPPGNESSRDQKIWYGSSSDADPGDAELKNSGTTHTFTDRTWRVYPNPASTELFIDVHTEEVPEYSLYGGLGRAVRSGEYLRGQSIPISDIEPGLYYLKLDMNEEMPEPRKVLIVR